MVPHDAPDSNHGNTRAMLCRLGITEERSLYVHTQLGVEAAAARLHSDIEAFFAAGGRLTLGLLGLGTDGHTASLFNRQDAEARDRYAISVRSQPDFDRVSVSAAVLERAEELIFLVTGEGKLPILRQFLEEPATTPAGIALGDHPNVVVWTEQSPRELAAG